MDFSKQELALIHDLITICWQAGAVKAPQMGQSIEQLRAKVLLKMEPPPADSKKIPEPEVKG